MTKRPSRRTKMPLSNVAIRASAGSGKTYQLTLRYVGLLAAGVGPESILATTFTRKAAGEILARVVERLADAALDPSQRERLARELKLPALDERTAVAAFDRLIESLATVRIGTMDRFFSQWAREYEFELDLPIGWSVLEEFDDIQVRDEALEEFFATEPTESLVRLSRMLSRGEIERSVRSQVDDLVKELQSIYRDAPASAWEPMARTAELSIPEVEAALAGLRQTPPNVKPSMQTAWRKDLAQAEQGQWLKFLADGIAKAIQQGEVKYNRMPIPEPWIEPYQRLVAHAVAVIHNRWVERNEATRELIAGYDRCYQRAQSASAGLRFDDVTRTLATSDLLANADRDSDIRHLLLDEFQDTAPMQWRVFAPMAGRCGAEGSFFCVGDPKQAIYGWRGGSAQLFDYIGRVVEPLEGQELVESYRSSPVIIDVVNQLFGTLQENLALASRDPLPQVARDWSRRFQEHRAAKKDLGGYARLIVAPVEEESDAEDPALEYAADLIAERHGQVPNASIGVLVRENKAVGQLLFLLRQRGVEASEEGGNPLSRSPAVSLILSFLEWLDHPDHTIDRFHFVRSELGARLGVHEPSDEESATRVATEWRARLCREGLTQGIRAVVELLFGGLSEPEQDRLEQLVELAIRFESRGTRRLSQFVDYVEHQKVDDPRSSAVRVMTVHQAKGLEFDIVYLPQLNKKLSGQTPTVAIHRPSPIEPIDIVAYYAGEKERLGFPDRLQECFDQQVLGTHLEALCVLYVAMTRAIHELHMIVPVSRKKDVTLASVVCTGLANRWSGEAGETLFEHGDSDWWRTVKFVKPTPPEPCLLRVPEHLTVARSAGKAVAPSQRHAHESAASILAESDTAARERGLILHDWFSTISWLGESLPSDEELLLRARSRFPGSADAEGLLAEFRAMLDTPGCRELLQEPADTGGSIELWRERSFALRWEGEVLRGVFDRVVIRQGPEGVIEATVVDFKTDRLADERAVPARAEVYRPQLETYCEALASLLKVDKVRVTGQLMFLSLGRVWTLPR